MSDTGVILETFSDKKLEARTIERILSIAKPNTVASRFPDLSVVDFILTRNGSAVSLIEIKTRKETVEQIKNYGGLILKHRKLTELQTLATFTNTSTYVIFAFENGEGPIMLCDVMDVTNVQPQPPPERRNYRGLPCDEEHVIFLDWNNHLKRIS